VLRDEREVPVGAETSPAVVDVRDEELPSRFGGGFMSSEEQGRRVRASRDAEKQARAAGNQAQSGGTE
jgi:hypothetical protein